MQGGSERKDKRSRYSAGCGNGNVAGPHPENLLLGSCASLGIAVLLLHQPELHEAEHPRKRRGILKVVGTRQ